MMLKLLIALFISSTSLAHASIEEEKKIYRLCYAQLVKKRVPATEANYVKVKAGTLKGSEACIELVNSVQLDNDGMIPMLTGNQIDTDKQKIFQTIFDIHHDVFTKILGLYNIYKFDDYYGTYKIVDESEMAYHFTYPFVKSGVAFNSALTNNFALKSIRYSQVANLFPNDYIFRNRFFNGAVDIRLQYAVGHTTIPAIDKGLLIGLTPAPNLMLPYKPRSSDPEVYINSSGHHGGGAMGSAGYLLLNNHIYVGNAQGGVLHKMPRNFAVSVLRDLLCRDMPVIRASDVSSLVNMQSPVSFHQNSKCMRCHATMDPMVYTIKNKFNITSHVVQNRAGFEHWTPAVYPTFGIYGMMVGNLPVTSPHFNPEGDLLTADSGHHALSKPIGRLRMRSAVTGNLYDQKVENIDGLAAAIAQTDDFYACSVKRYVTYFTGHDTKLFDPADDSYEAYNKTFDRNLREFIFQLAAELKQHQDVKRTWKRIFNNRIFLDPEKGDFSEVGSAL